MSKLERCSNLSRAQDSYAKEILERKVALAAYLDALADPNQLITLMSTVFLDQRYRTTYFMHVHSMSN